MWRSLRTVAPSAAQAKLAAGMPRKQLVGFGTAFGKFTKSKQFRLHVTCLDFVAQHAQHGSTLIISRAIVSGATVSSEW